jgi:DnaJ family protein B protein 11
MTEQEEISLTVDVQAGMRDGDTVKFDQVADEAVGHIPGDLIFVIVQTPHPLFRRDGDNLHVDFTISLLESLVGFSKTIEHLDGHKVEIIKSDVTFCSQVVTVRGEGMPRRGSRSKGDLFVTLHIEFPREFNDRQKGLIRQAMQ